MFGDDRSLWDSFTNFLGEGHFWMVCFRVDLHGFLLRHLILPKDVFQLIWKVKGKTFEVLEALLRGDDKAVRGAKRPPFLDLHGRSKVLVRRAHRGLKLEPYKK